MNELEKRLAGEVTSSGEERQPDTNELFLDRITTEPAFRLQLSQALHTYHIPLYTRDTLGYTVRPFAEVLPLIEHLELTHLTDADREAVAQSVLDASVEVRDELTKFLARDSADSTPVSRSDMPFPLQFVVIAKACAGHQGSNTNPRVLTAENPLRGKLSAYCKEKFMLTDEHTTKMLDAIAIVHGAQILKDYFSWGADTPEYRTLAPFPPEIVGHRAPRVGYYLPDAIEDALQTMRPSDLWRLRYIGEVGRDDAADGKLIEGVEWVAQAATELAGESHDTAFWRGYIVTALLAAEAFRGRISEGYSGSYDQLVSWHTPKPDQEYHEGYTQLMQHIARYEQASMPLAEAGKLLALTGVAIRIGHDVEREIIYGNSDPRAGRIKVVADIASLISAADHTVYVADLQSALPLLASHLTEQANRWKYRFS